MAIIFELATEYYFGVRIEAIKTIYFNYPSGNM